MAKKKGPWERQSKESNQAYEAARLYFEKRIDRSLSSVGKRLGKSQDLMERWSSRWSWVDRAAAYDAHMDQIEQDARESALVTDAAKWAERQRSLKEREFTLAEALLTKAEMMLKFPLQTQKVEKDGKMTIINPADWSLRDAAKLLETASKVARLSAGMVTEKTSNEVTMRMSHEDALSELE